PASNTLSSTPPSGPGAGAGTPTATPPTPATATRPCATTTTCTSRRSTDGTGRPGGSCRPGPGSPVGRYAGDDPPSLVTSPFGRVRALGPGRAGPSRPHRRVRPPAAPADGVDGGERVPRPAGSAPGRPGPVRPGGGRAGVPGPAGRPAARPAGPPGGQRGRGRARRAGPAAGARRGGPPAAGRAGGGAVPVVRPGLAGQG